MAKIYNNHRCRVGRSSLKRFIFLTQIFISRAGWLQGFLPVWYQSRMFLEKLDSETAFDSFWFVGYEMISRCSFLTGRNLNLFHLTTKKYSWTQTQWTVWTILSLHCSFIVSRDKRYFQAWVITSQRKRRGDLGRYFGVTPSLSSTSCLYLQRQSPQKTSWNKERNSETIKIRLEPTSKSPSLSDVLLFQIRPRQIKTVSALGVDIAARSVPESARRLTAPPFLKPARKVSLQKARSGRRLQTTAASCMKESDFSHHWEW